MHNILFTLHEYVSRYKYVSGYKYVSRYKYVSGYKYVSKYRAYLRMYNTKYVALSQLKTCRPFSLPLKSGQIGFLDPVPCKDMPFTEKKTTQTKQHKHSKII